MGSLSITAMVVGYNGRACARGVHDRTHTTHNVRNVAVSSIWILGQWGVKWAPHFISETFRSSLDSSEIW